MTQLQIGFAGMTHLGLVSGIAAAEKGFKVLCLDQDLTLISELQKGQLPISEPQLDELLRKNASRITFTSDPRDLERCEVVYVSPDVATDDYGNSDLSVINRLTDVVFANSSEDAALVFLSQIPPGFTRKKERPGRALYCQVETLIFGRAVERASHPERYIVGCHDPLEPLHPALREFLEAHNCPILKMRYESAELAKISINMFLVSSVTTTNTIAELCEKVGADWREIAPALKLDKRIGPYAYLVPGLGIAGGNLERDLSTVRHLADEYGTNAEIVDAWIKSNEHRRKWALRTLYRVLLSKRADPLLAVLGLAYKQDTHSVKNSPSIALLSDLMSYRVKVYDPLVSASGVSNPRKISASSALDACADADAVVIMTPWEEFRRIDPQQIAASMKGNIILDPFAALNSEECIAAGLDYYTLGVSEGK